MINVTIVAATPQDAYMVANDKYGEFELLSAKQIHNKEDNSISCEITISISKEKFLQLPTLGDNDNRLGQIEDNNIEIVKRLFESKGISREWLDEILEPFVGSTVAENQKILVSYLLEEMDETIVIKKESFDKQKIMMFVGPTGVGKTTTVAKLAARYAYMMERPHRVALISLDSYKVGAIEQLSHFADIMKIKLFTANSIDEFKELFDRVGSYDIVLIDTAGMSPFDTEKLLKMVEYLSTNTTTKIEVNLVVSATVKYEDAKDIYETFSFLNLDSLILSKLDETRHLGSILSYLLLYPIPLSYFSIGQEVPDDLMVANKEYLLQKFIGDLNG